MFLQLVGNSLGSKTKISLGGVDATAVSCPDPTYCYMNTPAHAVGKVQVTVTTNGITSAPAKSEFTFAVFPTVTGILTDKGGPPTVVTFTGTGFSTTPGQTQFNFFGIPVQGTCSSTTQCTAIPVPDVDGSATSTEVTVTVNGITSLDSVLYSEGTKPILPKCKSGTCS
jgi:large repetitive protein